MKGRSANKKEKNWMDSVSQMGCIVCKLHYDCFTPAEIHHISGKTKPGAHLKTIGLCYRHHREGVNNEMYVSRHPNKREFEKRYGTEEYLLEQTKVHLGETNA
jgi:hypothetical protein